MRTFPAAPGEAITAAAMRHSFESGTRWSTRTPAGDPDQAERGHRPRQVINAMQRLDDDALYAEIVTPDFFHQFGVVFSLHPDSAGLGHPGTLAGHAD
ncbi:hypothetical protein AHiyo4_25090 [Arthrobacter sp. Hiyo4]|nr:hypothetical protein AHiyo4_25090 [Arthrobacter sp. Hiyo4]